ncbi:hypothetical protein Q8F55_002869 [Vanrija albida]|uniref:GPN-loop GTPase n=1 Tax=Vanrija albida TaxID=181172 RepID=A0ABR3QBZ7_9TREE
MAETTSQPAAPASQTKVSEAAAASAAPEAGPSTTGQKEPVVVLVIGMAGSGKTTLMQRLNSYLHSKDQPPYILNLDPAVSHMPYSANIDIRDTVDYKEVMKQYNLGPNGGIMTALNLFTTKFDQVLGFVEKRAQSVDYVLVDTPGQIEIFTWSASGAIITDAIASSLPTVVAYIVDTPRTTSPATFMSNMLYACSILYKTRLPFILVFNKIDVEPHDFALEWMADFEKFQEALAERGRDENGENYMNSLMNSMSLVLEEFYNDIRAVGVSAMTGQGMKEFFAAVEEGRKEYETDYRPELERLKQEKDAKAEAAKQAHLERMMKDMGVDKAPRANPFGPHPRNEREDRYMDDEGGDSEDERIDRQQEAEEEADDHPEVAPEDDDVMQYGGRDEGMGVWPRPQ